VKFLFQSGLILFFLVATIQVKAQVDDFCAESGNAPSLDNPFSHIPYAFGRITVKGLDANAKFPDVTITLETGQRASEKINVSRSGNYCFRLRSAGGKLIVAVDGIEITRRSLPFALGQLREDFEIHTGENDQTAAPGVISAKFSRPVNPATSDLYKKAIEAERNKQRKEEIRFLKEIVSIDTADFVAWAKLGVIYQEKESYNEAIEAFKKSLEQKIEYTPAWINVGMIRIAQKQYEAAIAVLKQAAELDPTSARVQQLLGEAYLLSRQGSLGAQALNEAIKLDPIGMAESHLKLAHLYQLADANKMATREYKIFLEKVPNYSDKKKLEKFIKKYPDN